jgi:hypothetical protein
MSSAANDTLPSIDFSTLVVSLSQTALVHLGEATHPETGSKQPARDLPLARQTIDLLGVLQEKTKGNLTGDEERLLDQVLYDLRMRFVEVSKEEKKP